MKIDPNRLTAGEQAIYDLIDGRPRELTLAMIADELHSSPESVKVLISKARLKGAKIYSPRYLDPTSDRTGNPQTYWIEE